MKKQAPQSLGGASAKSRLTANNGGSWSEAVSKIFEAPCFQLYGVESTSRQLLDEVDATGLDQIAREFASLSNDVMGFNLVSFEEEAPVVSL